MNYLQDARDTKKNLLPFIVIQSKFLFLGTKLVGYNRMKFLLESLADLDDQFKKLGGHGLLLMRGNPVEIFRKMWKEFGITKICFEHDCEPIWNERDDNVKMMCQELGIQVVEKVSHTLWNPMDVIRTNGGKIWLMKLLSEI